MSPGCGSRTPAVTRLPPTVDAPPESQYRSHFREPTMNNGRSSFMPIRSITETTWKICEYAATGLIGIVVLGICTLFGGMVGFILGLLTQFPFTSKPSELLVWVAAAI